MKHDQSLIMLALSVFIFALRDETAGIQLSSLLKSIGVNNGEDSINRNLSLHTDIKKPAECTVSDYCFGIRGLADYLGVSAPTAQKYVNSGQLDSAIRRVGRKYSFRKSELDDIFSKKGKSQ